MRPNVYAHMLCITSPPVRLHVSASHQLNSCLNRLADKSCQEMASTARKAHAPFWIQKKKPTLPSAGPLISPGDPVCMTSICDNKCFGPRVCDITAFCWLSLCARCLPLCGVVGLQGRWTETLLLWDSANHQDKMMERKSQRPWWTMTFLYFLYDCQEYITLHTDIYLTYSINYILYAFFNIQIKSEQCLNKLQIVGLNSTFLIFLNSKYNVQMTVYFILHIHSSIKYNNKYNR